jgi:transcriptional regulator with XRE-family HTH domain
LAQHELAHLVKRSPSAITQWETGKFHPRRASAVALDEALNAGGAVMVMFGYLPQDEPDETVGEVSRLDAGEEALRRVLDLAEVVDQLLARVAQQDAELAQMRRAGRRAAH